MYTPENAEIDYKHEYYLNFQNGAPHKRVGITPL